MRAYELKKEGVGERGRIQMIVEGVKAEVEKVDAILTKDYVAIHEDDDTQYGGKFALSYFVDRNEKAEFMFAYKAAKAAVKGK